MVPTPSKKTAAAQKLDHAKETLALSVIARMIELGGTFTKELTVDWLRNSIAPAFTGDDYILPMARMARASGVAFDTIHLTLANGTTIPLNTRMK